MPFTYLPTSLKSLFDQPVSTAYGEIEQEDIRQWTPCRAKERDAYGCQGHGDLNNLPLLDFGHFKGIKLMAKHFRSGYSIEPHVSEDQVYYQDLYLHWQDAHLVIAILSSQVCCKGCERNEH